MSDTETKSLNRNGSSLENALVSYSEALHKDLSKNRFAEEREWYECALFQQRRQWLKWDSSNKRWSMVKQDPNKPRPMPVTNHYAKTINAQANQLGGGKMDFLVIPDDDSDKNRRAAEYAEKAAAAIDRESGFRLQRALLAKHVVLWGVGVTVDYFCPDDSEGTIKVPVIELQQTLASGCMDCGNVAYSDAQACPQCGSPNQVQWQQAQPQIQEIKQFVQGKIRTEVRPIFEFFFPRDCTNPNLARKSQRKYRKPLSEAKGLWKDKAEKLQAETAQDTPTIYMEALRALVNYNYMHESTNEGVSVVETYVQWDQLPEDLQEKVEAAVQAGQDDAGQQIMAPDGELDPVEQLHKWGIYVVTAATQLMDWGINPHEGETPWTVWQWQMDPANVYAPGLGADLVPLQRRLNRIDSLIELAYMSNAAGKWLWPSTQASSKPSGSPTDVIEYDPIGDGKNPPTFVQPSPVHQSAHALRAQIKQDFLEIGMTEGVEQGQQPAGVTAFRGLAYLGAKAAEQISTQRNLFETSGQIRHEKCLKLAKKYWDTPRRVKVAGYNGKWGMSQVMGQDLDGDYTIEVVQGSSRPRTPDEKEQQLQTLIQGGLIDITDPATRDYIYDELRVERVGLTNDLQYRKAERDLDNVIKGKAPLPVPSINMQIASKIVGDFMLTEEFEELEPDAQQRVEGVFNMMQLQIEQTMAAQAQQQMAAQANAKFAGAAGKSKGPPEPGLNGVPGVSTTPETSGTDAINEGQNLASHLP